MSLPKSMRLKGHRTLIIFINTVRYNGELMTFKVVNQTRKYFHPINSKTSNNLRIAIAISKKVSKKAVDRNKIRRFLQEWLLTNIQKFNNHKPY